MSALLPAAVYGLDVPPGDVTISARPDFPAAFRITMAAIDPSAEPEFAGSALNSTTPRATLKLVRQPLGADDDSEDYEDDEDLQALLNGNMDDDDDDDEDSEDDEDVKGGPSDPSKTQRARKEAAVKALKEAIEDRQDKKELVNGVNGAGNKGKGKALAMGDEDVDMSDDEDLDDETEEFVLCTLDPNQHYQQPLDITVGEDERVFFKVSGTHTIYLTGNYVIPVDDRPRQMYDEDDDDEVGEYDLSPDEDELDDESESDELDDVDDPRIMELPDDEEAPKLVVGAAKNKGKNKRPALDSSDVEEPATLDSIMEKSLKAEPLPNGDVKLTKKQAKKLKNNAGQPVASSAESETKVVKKDESPAAKKVQFAKNLEQGPTGKSEPPKSSGSEKSSQKPDKNEKVDKKESGKKVAETPKAATNPKTIQGVTIDDKKLGSGPTAKKGNKVSMRYIGKLADGKVFDANKKGKPFSFKLGAGEVIKGWEIGIEGISVGGERRVIVPAHLGYGSKAMAGIPANSQLTFDVKCLEIN